MIFPHSELSDHFKIATEIQNMKDIKSQKNTYRWLTLNKAFKWTENSIFLSSKKLSIKPKLKHQMKIFKTHYHQTKMFLKRKKTEVMQKSLERFTGKTEKKCTLWFDKNVIK